MRALPSTTVAIAAFLSLAACSDRSPVAPGDRAPRLAPSAKAGRSIVTSSADIDMISVEAFLPGEKSSFLYDFPLQDGAAKTSLTVPTGEGYQLVVRAYDRYGRETHEAKQTLNYVALGPNEPLGVELAPVVDGLDYAKAQLDVVGQEHAPAGVQIYVKASAKSALQGQTITYSAQVVDANGSPIALKPGDLTWAISDPSLGRLIQNPEKQTSASILALRPGYGTITPYYKGFPHPWPWTFLLDPYVQIAAGFDFACAVRQSGALTCWGNNDEQQLGTVTAPNSCPLTTTLIENCSDTPIRVTNRLFSSVTTGWYHACAIESGTSDTYCWADNYYGQLGVGTKGSIQLPAVIPNGPKFKQISAGRSHTCAVAIVNAELFCWGDNYWGELGVGSYGQNNNPSTGYLTVTEKLSPNLVPNYGGWSQVTAGEDFTCGINGGGAMCWGMYNEGEIGIGASFPGTTDSPRYITTTYAPATLAKLSVSTIGPSMCGITGGNAAWCWGSNDGQKLGVPNLGQSAGVATAVSGGHNFTTISNGSYHSCAVDDQSQVLCWGFNFDGRTGQPAANTTNATPLAVTVPNETFSAVVAGGRFSCALTTSGRIYCWGSNQLGQLGNAAINAGTNVPQLVYGS